MQTVDRDAMLEGMAKMWQLSGGGIAIPIYRSAGIITCPVDTTEDILASIAIPAGLLGPSGILKLKAAFLFTNNANNKTFKVRLGGIGGTILVSNVLTTQVFLNFDLTIWNRGAQNSQAAFYNAWAGGGSSNASSAGMTPAAIDTSAATTLVITGQKAVGSDSLTLEAGLAEVTPG